MRHRRRCLPSQQAIVGAAVVDGCDHVVGRAGRSRLTNTDCRRRGFASPATDPTTAAAAVLPPPDSVRGKPISAAAIRRAAVAEEKGTWELVKGLLGKSSFQVGT